jgi:hypothetical protein
MSRGVLYMVWGNSHDAALERSIASLRHWHPELPYHVERMPDDSTVLCKAQMYDRSPYDETLYLDADTVVLGDLGYGFMMADYFGIALTHSANPWQCRYDDLPALGHADEVEYSSGVAFFNKMVSAVEDVFAFWENCKHKPRTRYIANGNPQTQWQYHNDQALLTWALMEEPFNPFVLPLNWNFVPRWHKTFFGPIRIAHAIEPESEKVLAAWNAEQSKPGAIIRAGMLA